MSRTFFRSLRRKSGTALDSLLPHRLSHLRQALATQWFAVTVVCALAVAVLSLIWIGNRAFAGWQRSAALLAERRAEEKAMLLSVALDRDMKAVQTSVLARFGGRRLAFRDPYDLFDLVEATFSQFPYAESIFVWRVEPDATGGRLYVFNRVDRQPGWANGLQHASPFPVALVQDPSPLVPMIASVRANDSGEQFLLDEFQTGNGRRYQVAASLFYDFTAKQPLVGAVGFLADLTWIREHYFSELMKQVETVIGEPGVRFSILDEHATPIVTTGSSIDRDGPSFERHFPLAFFDRSLLAAQSKLATTPLWTIRVDSSLSADWSASPWGALWWLMAVTATAALVSVVLVAQSIRAQAELTTLKSDFVATVTHDLKTPLALIRVVGETLGYGRYRSDHRIDEYGKLLRLESSRLALRIDNLLSYARATDDRGLHRFDAVDPLDVVHESLHRAEPRLVEFEVDLQLTDTPPVLADHDALLHVFDNLLDNAIKYSPATKRILIRTMTMDRTVVIEVSDSGTGIEQDDLDHVFEKFYRGRNRRSGSGLGLAIARKIVLAHMGSIGIASTVGVGTTVTVTLPLSEHQ